MARQKTYGYDPVKLSNNLTTAELVAMSDALTAD